ncbi:unnamed protein product [Calypogeia fissa]
MEPIGDPPPPAKGGQGGHAHSCTERKHKEKKLIKQVCGKRPATSSLFLPDISCPLQAMKHLKRSWWSRDTVAVVTGGNKGLGLEIVRQLANEGLTVVLTARDSEKGQNALNALKDEGLNTIIFHQLDVTSSRSVEALADWLMMEFGGLDILVNNAGVHFYSETHEDAVEIFETNYYGVKRVINALLPLMRESWNGARIINVSSQAASLQNFNTSCLKDKVSDVDCLSEAMVDDLATKYLGDVKAGKWKDAEKEELAMNNYQYCESKLLLNTYTQILARSLAFKQPQCHKIFVNAMCPGSPQTDMGAFVVRKPTEAGKDIIQDVFRGCTIQSIVDGADTAVWLALLPRASHGRCYPNGRFFSDKKDIAF